MRHQLELHSNFGFLLQFLLSPSHYNNAGSSSIGRATNITLCHMLHPLLDALSLDGMTARRGAPSSRATCYMHHATCYAHSAVGCPRFWDDGSRGAPPSRANATRTKHCHANAIGNLLHASPTLPVDALSFDRMTARGLHRRAVQMQYATRYVLCPLRRRMPCR